MKILPLLMLFFLLTDGLAASVMQRSFKCDLKSVRVKAERISILCKYSKKYKNKAYVKSIPFYSAPFSQKNTERMLDVLALARAQNKPVVIYHEDGPKGNPAGCGGGDCRRLIAVRF